MSIFPYIPEVVWAIINFLVLFFILKKFLFGPILGMMEQRRKEIAENLTKADEAQREAEKLRQDYLDQMAAARKEAQDIITQANKAGDAVRAELLEETRAQASSLLSKAQETIHREKDKALAELREEVASLAILAASKVIDKALTMDDHGRLVKDFVNEVGKPQ